MLSYQPDVVWRPGPEDIDGANATHFMSWLNDSRGTSLTTWNDLWEWSVHDLNAFWAAVWDYYDVTAARQPDHVATSDAMPHTRWFGGAQLNYAQNVLARAPRTRPALIEIAEDTAEAEAYFRAPRPFYCIMRRSAYDEFVAQGIPLTVVYEREGMTATSGRALWRSYTPMTRFVVVSGGR